MQLEQHVAIEVREDLVQVDLELADAPPRRRRYRRVGARLRAHAGVGDRRQILLDDRLVSQGLRLVADARDQRLARLLVDQLVDRVEALERILAVEDAGRVDLVRLLALRVEDAAPEVAVDRRAAHEHRELEPALVQLGDTDRHLLGGRDEQRRQPDRGGLVLDGGVDDRVDRDLLAQVDDRVAVVREDRVDKRLANIVHVAEHGRDHDRALGVALDLL